MRIIFEDEMKKSTTESAVALKPVEPKDRDILFNLLEKYLYEFSQYDGGKFGNKGVFGYPYIDNYFTEKERFAYFITVDDRLAGFVLLNNHPEADKPIDYSVAEFFVAYNFRRQGVATRAMEMIFQQHKGYYHIKYHKNNLPSACFWNKLADKYSNGTYETLTGTDTFHDGTRATVLWFKME